MNESLFYNGKVVNLLVAVNVVNNAAEILLALVSMNFPAEFREYSFWDGKISSAYLLIFNANILVASVLVVAEKCKAFWEDNNGIPFNNISL